MKRLVILAGILLYGTTVAQNIGINANGAAPNNSAMLDVDVSALPANNKKGLLVPRVALASATDGVTIPSPATSLMVYNTGTGGLAPAGYYYNAGTPGSPNWVRLLITGTPADAWLTNGNAGTTAGTNFLGTTDNVDLVFKTNNIERMRVLSSGRVGINTPTPGSYYLDVLSNNSSIDGIRGQHTSGATASAFAAVTGSVSNGAYTNATGYLGYHNSNNITFAVYGNGGDLAGMFNGRVGINSISTNLTNYDLEVRNSSAANPSNVLFRATAQKPNTNDILTNLDFGDSYVSTAQAKIQVSRDAAASSATDLPTALTFWTTPDATSTPIERMRISNNGNVGIGTSIPNNNALLHVSSSNKGVMLPKVNLTGATDNVTIPVSSPADDALMVYNTATAGSGTNAITPGYYYWQAGRWTKLQTNGYAGVIFGFMNSTLPNHMTTLSPSYQYTGSYIDLPPGKWVVYIYLLLSPYNSSANNNTWDVTGSVAIWSRNTLSDSNVSFAISGDIIGSPFCSGVLPNPSNYGMATGAIYVKNSTSGIKRYYLWGNIDKFGSFTNCGLFNFAANYWGENQFFAIPAE